MHDHRRLGRELEIFDTDPLIGAGLPFWLPAGATATCGTGPLACWSRSSRAPG